MYIPSRPVGHIGRRITLPPQRQVVSHTEKPELVQDTESSDALLEAVSLEMPDETRSVSHIVVARRRKKRVGYDRNWHRRQDEQKHRRKRRRVFVFTPSMALAVAAFVVWGSLVSHPEVLSPQEVSAVKGTSDVASVFAGRADEQPAENYIAEYAVTPNYPRLVTIPSLDVQARVFEVGVDGRGQPQLAKNSYDAGWYNVSVLPGSLGASVLSGACSGTVGQGVFYRLSELQSGDQIIIERGDGVRLVYEVAITTTVAVDDVNMVQVLTPAYRLPEGLNLVGCVGAYDAVTNDFADRTVVYAVQK